MTEQEEIREGFEDIWCEDCGYHASPEICSPCKVKIEKLFSYLHSQGVVIKGQSLGGSHPHLASYFTVESLIKEE